MVTLTEQYHWLLEFFNVIAKINVADYGHYLLVLNESS